MRSQESCLSVKSVRGNGFVRAGLFVIAVLAVFTPAAARACPAQIAAAAATPIAKEVAYMAALIYWWNYYMYDLMDRLPRMSNNDTANTESENRATTTNTDKVAIEQTRLSLGESRSTLAAEFVPSKTTCEIVSQQKRLANSEQNFTNVGARLNNASTAAAVGAPGSGTEKGAIQSFGKVFKSRCSTYLDGAAINMPSDMNCSTPTDPKMVNRDISPWTSIFQPINLPAIPGSGAWPQYTQAAYDTIALLLEPVVADHVKGAALSRPEGRNIHVLRMRDLSRMNLARGALEDIVAKRIVPSTADPVDGRTVSRLGRYIEMISGQTVGAGDTVSGELNSIFGAGNMKNGQLQTLVARLESQKMMLAEFLRYTDQLLAMEAVQLSLKIEETKTGGAGAFANMKGN